MTVRSRCFGLCGQDIPIVAAEFCGSAGVATSQSTWFTGTSVWASQSSVTADLGRADGVAAPPVSTCWGRTPRITSAPRLQGSVPEPGPVKGSCPWRR